MKQITAILLLCLLGCLLLLVYWQPAQIQVIDHSASIPTMSSSSWRTKKNAVIENNTFPASETLVSDKTLERQSSVKQYVTLMTIEDTVANIDSVALGMGKIHSEDLAEYRDWVQQGRQGAGPQSEQELANIEQWIDIPARLLPSGDVEAGPLTFPEADRYTLLAASDDNAFYFAEFDSAETAPSVLLPDKAASLEVLIQGISDFRDSSIELIRKQTSPQWLDVIGRYGPRFGDEIKLSETQLIQPIAPDSKLEVVLYVKGIEAGREQVRLSGPGIYRVEFDQQRVEKARKQSGNLGIQFLLKGTQQPIQGLQVILSLADREQAAETDGRGEVWFPNLDFAQVLRFNLQARILLGSLPLLPEIQPLMLDLRQFVGKADNLSHRELVELEPIKWLAVSTTPDLWSQIVSESFGPFPIYLLQQWQAGDWISVNADHFVQLEDSRIAVSVLDTGRFRVLVATSPWRFLLTEPVEVGFEPGSIVNAQLLAPIDTFQVMATILQDSKPLINQMLRIRGPNADLPHLELQTSSSGQINLGSATTQSVWVTSGSIEEVKLILGDTEVILELPVIDTDSS